MQLQISIRPASVTLAGFSKTPFGDEMRRILGCWQGLFLKKRPVFWKARDAKSRRVSNPKWTFRGFSQKHPSFNEGGGYGPPINL
jgi:hypothetical protein